MLFNSQSDSLRSSVANNSQQSILSLLELHLFGTAACHYCPYDVLILKSISIMWLSRTWSTGVEVFIWLFLSTQSGSDSSGQTCTALLKWSFNPSQTTLTEQVEQMYVRGMKSTCSGFFYYTVPYYNIQYLLKFRNRQYTGMSVTMSQGGWRRKIPSGYLILYSKHILQPS